MPRSTGTHTHKPMRNTMSRTTWLALALIALIAASCPATARAQRPTNCPKGPDAILTSLGNQGKAAPPNNATELINGCSYAINVPYRKELYLTLKRPAPGTRLSIDLDLKGEISPPVILLSWAGQCCNGIHPYVSVESEAIYADFGFEPLSWHSNKVYAPAANGRDEFHCRPACTIYQEEEHMEDLFITISTWLSYGAVEGNVRFTYMEERPLIKEDQLAAVKDIYDQCCAARRPPSAAWSWEDYKTANTTDTYKKPYCDWLAGSGWADFGTNSCEDIEKVFCDAEGNVVDILLTESGLQCVLPDSMAALTSLETLQLGSNQIFGTIPQALLGLPNLRTVNLARNRLEGPAPCLASPILEVLDLSTNLLEGGITPCLAVSTSLSTLRLASNRLRGALPAALAQLGALVDLDLSQNFLTGEIPAEIGTLPSLAYLRLSRNRLGGNLPPSILAGLTRLYELDLSFNRFEGEFPDIHNLHNLHNLYLGHSPRNPL